MKTLEEQLQAAGLKPSGCCTELSSGYGNDFLQTSQLLQDMTPAEADTLGAAMLLIRVEPGEVLIREGDAGEWMLLVLKGTVDVTKRVDRKIDNSPVSDNKSPTGDVADNAVKELDEASFSRIAVIKSGATLGEMSMLDSEPRYATCTAIEAVEAGVLGRREISLLIHNHPAVGAKLLVKITQLMAQRLRNTSNQLVKLLQKQ